MPHLFYGLYKSLVIDDDDPEGLYRLKVSAPGPGVPPLGWAQACLPPGTFDMPRIDDEVWVMFEAGNPGRPVWLGVAYNLMQRPDTSLKPKPFRASS